jgi:hypothetical protein
VHLEALKADLPGLPRRSQATPLQRCCPSDHGGRASSCCRGRLLRHRLGQGRAAGDAAIYDHRRGLLAAYVGLMWVGSRQPVLHTGRPQCAGLRTARDPAHAEIAACTTCCSGGGADLVPDGRAAVAGLSAFWATMFMIFVMLTQRPLMACCAARAIPARPFGSGLQDLIAGLEAGARNMIGIGVATAAAGIIVGTVSLTGIGLVMTEVVELLSGGNLMLMLVLVAVISLILGMGLPTTANYIVVSTLMAPVVVELGCAERPHRAADRGAHVRLLFRPDGRRHAAGGPGLVCGGGIARSDPIKTGITAFGYSMRTAILPFLFIFNTQLLLIGIDSVGTCC